MALLKYDGSAAAETQAPVALYGDASRVETLAGTSANEQFWLSAGDKAAEDQNRRPAFGEPALALGNFCREAAK